MAPPATPTDRQPSHRLVALGASNLTRIFATLAGSARGCGPVEILAAHGYGRSFGLRTRLLWRELPGIRGCGLWPALAARPALPTTAIVMDVGNDIFYGVEPEIILDWVEQALRRLRPQALRLVLAGVPPSVFELGRARFELIRRLLVPGCTLTHELGMRRADELQRGLAGLAQRIGATFHETPAAWQGWDRIHVRRRHWRALGERLLGERLLGETRAPDPLRAGRAGMRSATPAQRWLFGRERRAAQPSAQLPDGTTVALY